ncbi:hypothetical protein [Streptomyces triculaminicus]|uniref:hypothetical protein n=1 Tax=Streptomyces triculaminicus TaxID=2816232 RepID=UPI0037D042DB
MADHTDRTQTSGQRQRAMPADHGAPTTKGPQQGKLPGALRTRWDGAWVEGGFLHDRWEDLLQARDLGWRHMANWLKVFLAAAGLSIVVLLLDGAAGVLADTVHQLLTAAPRVPVGTDTSSGVFSVIDQPIRTYIATHSTSLTISDSSVYTVWQVVGLFGLVGGFFRSTGARLTWTAWGAVSIAMVWSSTPAAGRPISTGLAVLAWTAVSAFALRGLSLRPSLFIHNAAPQVRNEIRPEIHVPAPADPPDGDAPDNVLPLQKR